MKLSQRAGKIVPFIQSAEFFHRRGNARQDEGALLNALNLYRKAIAMEPRNPEYRLRLAETYANMSCYELSNRVLFGMLWRCEQLPGDFFYAIGCNYVGLQEYALALECFRRYSQTLVEGDATPEAGEILQLLDAIDTGGPEGVFPDGDAAENGGLIIAEHARKHMMAGDFDTSAAMLSQAHELAPDSATILTALASSYMSLKKYSKARTACDKALKIDPSDAQIYCILAMIGDTTEDAKLKDTAMGWLRSHVISDPDNAYRAAVTLSEFGDDASANKHIQYVLRQYPYDVQALHASAVYAYRRGEFEHAFEIWSKLQRVLFDDPIASFFVNFSREASMSNKNKGALSDLWQLPELEAARRTNAISAAYDEFKDGRTGFEGENYSFTETLLWGINYAPDAIKEQAIPIVARLNFERAEEILRDFVLRIDHSENCKRIAFEELKRIGAHEPYVAVTDDGIVEVRVGIITGSINMPEAYRDVAEYVFSSLSERGEEECVKEALGLWQSYIDALEMAGQGYPDVDVPTFAAASEYIARFRIGKRVSQKKICQMYGVTEYRLKQAVKGMDLALDLLY